jgi:hypothetical protein
MRKLKISMIEYSQRCVRNRIREWLEDEEIELVEGDGE